jgi:hypothetical protein
MKAPQPCEISETTCPVTQRHIPENFHPQQHPCDNFKSHSTEFVCYARRFTPEQRKDAAWVFAKSHESYATNYDIVFPHDEDLAGRNFRQGPFHQVCVI